MPRSRSPRRRSASRKSRSRSRSSSRGGKLKLVKLTKSPNKLKKYRAHFSDGTHTDFGAAGYSDYTKHKDASRKGRYDTRHRSRENWRSPKSAGALAKWILWNKPSLRASVADYKRKFGM
jgi:hypothetical protein